ncbi:MAG: hypothetical protein IPI40_00190 [Betaproteobacteria bacterium]|nr:hypothetical protein [Betaproteobacteria bacterium]
MPVIDVEIVGAAPPAAGVAALADALGAALDCPPGRAWVRLRYLAADAYAENAMASPNAPAELPIFVTVLHARPPTGAALDAEVEAIARQWPRGPVAPSNSCTCCTHRRAWAGRHSAA